ncbi:UNVERIFIED_CONTAM: hypothetical protein K2H54_013961 [Gekko kuhli]
MKGPLTLILAPPRSKPEEKREKPRPVNPINTRTQGSRDAMGKIMEQTIKETRYWRPDEAKAIAGQMGPFNKDNTIHCLIKLITSHPTANGADLALIAKRCASADIMSSLTSYVANRRIALLSLHEVMVNVVGNEIFLIMYPY